MADVLIRGMKMPLDGRKHSALIQIQEDGTHELLHRGEKPSPVQD